MVPPVWRGPLTAARLLSFQVSGCRATPFVPWTAQLKQSPERASCDLQHLVVIRLSISLSQPALQRVDLSLVRLPILHLLSPALGKVRAGPNRRGALSRLRTPPFDRIKQKISRLSPFGLPSAFCPSLPDRESFAYQHPETPGDGLDFFNISLFIARLVFSPEIGRPGQQ